MKYGELERMEKELKIIELHKVEISRRSVGICLIVAASICCLLFINILSANFGEDQSGGWMICMGMSLATDTFLTQPIKCILIYIILLFMDKSALNPTKDQTIKLCVSWTARKLISILLG